jgi:hypothetical protein
MFNVILKIYSMIVAQCMLKNSNVYVKPMVIHLDDREVTIKCPAIYNRILSVLLNRLHMNHRTKCQSG